MLQDVKRMLKNVLLLRESNQGRKDLQDNLHLMRQGSDLTQHGIVTIHHMSSNFTGQSRFQVVQLPDKELLQAQVSQSLRAGKPAWGSRDQRNAGGLEHLWSGGLQEREPLARSDLSFFPKAVRIKGDDAPEFITLRLTIPR